MKLKFLRPSINFSFVGLANTEYGLCYELCEKKTFKSGFLKHIVMRKDIKTNCNYARKQWVAVLRTGCIYGETYLIKKCGYAMMKVNTLQVVKQQKRRMVGSSTQEVGVCNHGHSLELPGSSKNKSRLTFVCVFILLLSLITYQLYRPHHCLLLRKQFNQLHYLLLTSLCFQSPESAGTGYYRINKTKLLKKQKKNINVPVGS